MTIAPTISSLTFFFPYYEVSGVPVLFSRLAQYLADEKKIPCYIVDYTEGYMGRTMQFHEGLKLIEFRDGEPFNIPENTILVMQSIVPYTMRPELKIPPTTRLFFWNLHPNNLVPTLVPFGSFFRNLQDNTSWFYDFAVSTFARSTLKEMQKFVKMCLLKKGLAFMDQPNLEKTIQRLRLNIAPTFLPLPAAENTEGSSIADRWSTISENALVEQLATEMRFAWVGRLCDFKSYILMYTMQRISEYAAVNQYKIRFYVVGSGEFEQEIKNLPIQHAYFEAIFISRIDADKLGQFFLNQVDVLVAMGTSALDGAAYGLPVLRLDFTYQPIKQDYRYQWLYESINYDVAHEITKNDFEPNNQSLEDKIKDLRINYKTISNKTLVYFNQHHALKSVVDIFLATVDETTLTYNNIDPIILKKGLLRRMRDVKLYKTFN